MKKRTLQLIACVILCTTMTDAMAQRIQQQMGRGIVAVKNGNNALITWRRMAQEPEDTQYNIYVNGVKLNTSPLTKTNYQTTATKVPAGGALAVDRQGFSDMITEKIKAHENIELILSEEVSKIPDGIVVIATGPLTSDALIGEITRLTEGEEYPKALGEAIRKVLVYFTMKIEALSERKPGVIPEYFQLGVDFTPKMSDGEMLRLIDAFLKKQN